MTTLEVIADYERRLWIGYDKLRELELAGEWNEGMYQYYLTLNSAYKQLCDAHRLFER